MALGRCADRASWPDRAPAPAGKQSKEIAIVAMKDVDTNRPAAGETGGGEHRFREDVSAAGSQALDRIKELIHQGNLRRITIRRDGQTIVQVPLTVAAVAALLAPQLMALGLAAAILTSCTIELHRIDGA
jgi:hypothetical protein